MSETVSLWARVAKWPHARSMMRHMSTPTTPIVAVFRTLIVGNGFALPLAGGTG
jgi:hypothetical protein